MYTVWTRVKLSVNRQILGRCGIVSETCARITPRLELVSFFIFFFCDLCECGGFTPIPWNECVPFVGGDNTSDFLSVLIQNSP